MIKSPYRHLAMINLKKNHTVYLPYLLAGVGAIAAYYNMVSLAGDQGIKQMPSASSVIEMLGLGTWVIGIFAAAILFYANSFLFKQRKKELGLYSVLGLERRHVGRVFLYESLTVACLSVLGGMITGLMFSKALFLIIEKLLQMKTPLAFAISIDAIAKTAGLFFALYFGVFLVNWVRIKLADPIVLLKSEQEGEREPKSSWLTALIGLCCLVGGYTIAIVVKSPLRALNLFFVAVLLVITGTYALFTAGSVTILKWLRKRKTFYYKPRNFIAVSGMIYRMKQNAAGLASICILCTMVVVAVTSAVALYAGGESSLRARYPYDICIDGVDIRTHEVLNRIPKEAGGAKVIEDSRLVYTSYFHIGALENGKIEAMDRGVLDGFGDHNNLWFFNFLSLNDYNRMAKTAYQLENNQALLYATSATDFPKVEYAGRIFQIKERLEHVFERSDAAMAVLPTIVIVLPDAAVDELKSANALSEQSDQVEFNLTGSAEQKIAYYHTLRELLLDDEGLSVKSVDAQRADWYAVNGGFMFLGVFLGILFLAGAALIIYYKQVTEGYQDRERFIIMQKVGMSKQEVKQAINRQVKMVFFLPILMAAAHSFVATFIIRRLLALFGLVDIKLLYISFACTIIALAAIYTALYLITAKVYAKIVQG